MDTSASLSMDLVANFNSSMDSRLSMINQPPTDGVSSSAFSELISAQRPTELNSMTSNLGAAFEFERSTYDSDSDSAYEEKVSTQSIEGPNRNSRRSARRKHAIDKYIPFQEASPTDEYPSPPSIFADPTPRSSVIEKLKGRREERKHNRNKIRPYITKPAKSQGGKKHQCQFCEEVWNEYHQRMQSKSSFLRPEHLSRHIKSAHNPEPFYCIIAGCHAHKDYVDNKGEPSLGIQSRHDNLKPHYRTHFRYGKNEKSGKNKRLSLKESFELDLLNQDERWTHLLAGRMSIDHPDEPRDFNYTWKMMGYSILETQNTRIKDLIPEWEGSSEETLDLYDARWKSLRNGTMTYELAMSRGVDMQETEAQGLLGVTMAETKAMGIQHLDGRWEMLLSGRMSMEDARKLGVEDLNRARRGVGKAKGMGT
ncbi:hypothetical protein P7C71_g4854, partial [Lecanoromycetidae sp. Uapishka_2]